MKPAKAAPIFPGTFRSLPKERLAAADTWEPSTTHFKINDPAGPIPDVRRPVREERYTQRVSDLNVVEQQFARGRLVDLERNRTLHKTATDAALEMMSSDQLDAFDVSNEPGEVLDAFGGHAVWPWMFGGQPAD